MIRRIEALERRVDAMEKQLNSLGKCGSVAMMIRHKEYERVLKAMRDIAASYDGHMQWSLEDRKRYRELRERRDALREVLGIHV